MKLNDEQVKVAMTMVNSGQHSRADIAQHLKVSRVTLWRALEAAKQPALT